MSAPAGLLIFNLGICRIPMKKYVMTKMMNAVITKVLYHERGAEFKLLTGRPLPS